MRWIIQSDTNPTTPSDIVQIVANNRSIKDGAAFANPTHPGQITLQEVGIDQKQLDAAVAVLTKAHSEGKNIVVFGDYDADGVCATAIAWRVLHDLGCVVQPFIPHREKHGYGLSKQAIDDCIAQNGTPAVFITVDTGIVAAQQLQYLQELGITTIVTDHHQPDDQLATLQAAALVHTTKLCGASVAWMLVREFERALTGKTTISASQLDLCGLATIADQVPLVEYNRSFALHGIAALQKTTRPGLQALADQSGVELSTATASTIGFSLAPRINAVGRLDHALDALRLLCTNNQQRATELAQVLDAANQQRQDMTHDLVARADALARQQHAAGEHVLIVHSDEFHDGIIGLIAGRLVQRYDRPVIVCNQQEFEGELVLKGSARSVASVNIVELLRTVEDQLLAVGGHPMAAGLTVAQSAFEQVKMQLQAHAKKTITEAELEPTLHIECALPLASATPELCAALQQLAPFGQKHPEPLFSFEHLHIADKKIIGSKGTHLLLTLTNAEGTHTLKALWWRAAGRFAELELNTAVRVAGTLQSNTWRNTTTAQCIVSDLQAA